MSGNKTYRNSITSTHCEFMAHSTRSYGEVGEAELNGMQVVDFTNMKHYITFGQAAQINSAGEPPNLALIKRR